jgi:hypothetical protein
MWDGERRGLVGKALISYMYVEAIAIQIMEPKKRLIVEYHAVVLVHVQCVV